MSELFGEPCVFCPPRGSLVRLHEWYGCKQLGTNTGLKMSAKDIAIRMKEIEKALLDEQWISKRPVPGPADNQIRAVVRSDIDTIEREMAKAGVRWTETDRSPGSRINGLELIRGRLRESTKDHPESPGLWFMTQCRAAISLLPTLRKRRKETGRCGHRRRGSRL